MKRRALLSICGSLILSACLGGSQKHPELAWIWLQNNHSDRYAIDLSVEDDGEVVFSDTMQLVAADAEMTDIRVTDPVDGPGQYTVRATIDGEVHEIDISEVDDGDRNCIGVRFTIRTDGSVETGTKVLQQC